MRHLTVLLLGIILLSGCDEQPEGFVIDGNIDGIADSSLVILYDMSQKITIDSAFTRGGQFKLSGQVDQPTGYYIMTGNEYTYLLVENVKMTFNAPLEDMHLYSTTTGGREQELLNEMQQLQLPYDTKSTAALDSIMTEQYSSEEEKDQLFASYNVNQEKSKEIYVDFGKRHPNSHLGMRILYQNRQRIDKDALKAIYEKVSPEYRDTPSAQALHTYLYDKTVEIGKPFIDFEVTTIDGEPFKLSSRQGNYIYLTFWSRGCGPCRMENKFLSQHYADIPEELEVVSFSLDGDIEQWKEASEVDNILWENVSDFGGEEGKVKTQYEVQALPTSYLIDREGIVRKRFGGFDPKGNIIAELETIIAELEGVR